MLYRHGDVLLAKLDEPLPPGRKLPRCVLAEGELTGHSHRIAEPGAAELHEFQHRLYLRVTADFATLVHQEHKQIRLERGVYHVWRQREYSPQSIRVVRD